MKKIITLTMLCACAIMTFFTGCQASESEKTDKNAVCYVIANTANSKGLNLNSPLIYDTVYTTIRNEGYIAVVNADGNPDIVYANSFELDDRYQFASKDKLDMEAATSTTNFISGMQSVIADDPEIDYLASLQQAVRAISSLEGYDSKSIIVVGTGLSTAGDNLNFCNNLLSAEPEVIINLLKEKSEIPDFRELKVYWQQMFDVASPQKGLNSAQKNKLREIYAGIVEAGGGTFIYNDIVATPVNENIEYPPVTPVDLPLDTPISFEPEIFESSKINVLKEPMILTEKMITFIGDKSEYLNPDNAVATLQPIADYLVNNDTTILLCGCTAGDTNGSYAIKLSEDRAEAVKSTLVQLGVDESRIICIGLGSSDPWHIYGVGYDGEAASSNRKVVVLDASSATAVSILNNT